MRVNKTEYYCDRCGQEIPENKARYFFEIDEYRGFKLYKPVKIKILRLEWDNAILCGTCKKSFGEWWKKGKEEGVKE